MKYSALYETRAFPHSFLLYPLRRQSGLKLGILTGFGLISSPSKGSNIYLQSDREKQRSQLEVSRTPTRMSIVWVKTQTRSKVKV
jgi:hypothetical protein